ncbi:hypothetical protein [Duganella sp. Dugasp56]|uniref:hypothetical protein n=1 Tax=Duganella sp. Dugasp56 TaxID=3243046 RepID=UPI0039B09B93
MILNFPPPANWQDFQILTLRLVEHMCDISTVREYGRQGQRQNGVDVYGEMPGELHLGVQCKQMQSDKQLTEALIKSEANDALAFNPPLNTFVIATTLKEDTAIHKAVTTLNKSKVYPFKISYWSWSHFNDKLNRSNQLVQDSYKEYAKAFGVDEQEKDFSALLDGFDRPAFTDDFSREVSCISFIEALGDTVLFLQTGMLRDRISRDLIGATYPLSLLPLGENKKLRTQLLKEVKDLRKLAIIDDKNGNLDTSRANEYNAVRGAVIGVINRTLAAHNMQLIKPDYWI